MNFIMYFNGNPIYIYFTFVQNLNLNPGQGFNKIMYRRL